MKTPTGSTPSSITTIGSQESAQSVKDDVSTTLDDYQNIGWKVILLLQFQPQFEVIIMMSIYLAYICSLLDITFAYSTPTKNIPHGYTAAGISFIYSFDVIYVVDIMSMISYKNTEWNEVKHLYTKRHSLMILLDIISILPLDAVYFSLTHADMRIIYLIRMRYSLRIFRFIIRISRVKNSIGNNNVLIELLEFLVHFSLILITISCIQYILECQSSKCPHRDFELFLQTLYSTSSKMTSRGFAVFHTNSIAVFIILTLTNFFSFLKISGFTVGQWLIALIHRLKRQNVFSNISTMIMGHIYASGCKDFVLVSTTRLFFMLFWKNREAIIFENFDKTIIPEVMFKEISLDNCWDSLKHSHLFRDKEVHFLRYIASLMQQKFMIPGEVIYRHNCFKGSMVYVMSGVIQILSEQDGETPILSFSGGTCIGESTLLIDYPSTCTVICQSYCELNILHKKDFLQVLKKYPKIYASMLADIKQRYKDVAQYQDILRYMLNIKTQKVDVLTLKWLKTTLQELMEKDGAVSNQYDKRISVIDKNTMSEFNRLVFCTHYLDLLVITEQIELVTDTIFLKSTCPCILQPDSFIVKIWNYVIAAAVLIFVFVYPYYASFQQNVSALYVLYSYVISFLYVWDIYIQLSTAIKTKDGIISQFSEIQMIKLQSLSFIVDLLALMPIELFVLFIANNISWQAYVLFQIPRLLKCYRIRILFDGSMSGYGVISQMYFKYAIYTIILVYYAAAIYYLKLCYQYECEKNSVFLNMLYQLSSKGKVYDTLLVFLYLANQQVTSLGMFIPAQGDLSSLYNYILVIQLIATLFYIYFLTTAVSIEALKKYDALKIQEYISDVQIVLQNLNVSHELYEQVILHIRGQMQYNRGCDIRYTMKVVMQYYHSLLVKEVRRAAYGHVIYSLPLLSKLSEEIADEMIGIFHGRIFAPGEVITYAGEVCKEIHIIQYGFCKMIEPSKDRTTKIIGPGYGISIIELCFGIPVINSIITLTHCRLLSAPYDEFMLALQLYPDVFLEIKKAVSELLEMVHIEAFTRQQYFDMHLFEAKGDTRQSFKNFGYKLDMDTKEGVDYHSYFDKLGYFGFMRYIFMRHTIRSYGRFLGYWEISRCIFAFLTAILSPVPLINDYSNSAWFHILLALDITAWIDIYVRHHICYFERGIEITHPLKTARNYWKHGFVIDLVGCLPFELIIIPMFGLQNITRTKVFLKTTRLLQVYRILCGIQFLEYDMIAPPRVWTMLKYMPIIIISINTIGSLLINLQCEFGPAIKATKNFADGVVCKSNTWLSESTFEKPLSPLRTHLYGLFVTTLMLTGPGLGGFNVQNIPEVIKATVLNMIGFWIFIYLSAKIIAANLFRNADLTLYQQSMHSLLKFLSERHIDEKLQNELIRHFEYIWHKKQGKHLNQIIKNFNFALQEDLLLDVFGKTMKESTIFANANSSFFRSLLLNIKHEIIINRGIICRVNDIHNNMYFIFKGQVEVLGADYNRLLILPIGSLFGTLDNCEMSRQTLTMVAKGHVELLCVKNLTFHTILANYHDLKFHYSKLIAINTDYLLGAEPPLLKREETLTVEVTVEAKKTTIISIIKSILHNFNTIKQRSAGAIWDLVILTFVYYIGSVLELYQMTVQFHTSSFVILLYCLDALFVVNIYLNFQTGYEDEYGILITDKRKIALRYMRSRTGFGLHFVSIFPLDLFSFIFTKPYIRWTMWSYSRCNRLIRIFFVNNYFQVKNQQLNINVYLMRTMALLVWASLFLQIITCLFITCICIDSSSSVSPLLSCNWGNMTFNDKIDHYLQRFSVVLYIFTTSSMADYFPNSPFLILFSMCLLIGCRFLTTIFVAEVSATLEIVLHNRVIYEEQVNMLRHHMVRLRTSPALLERVWLYVCLLWEHKRGLQFPSFLEEAPYYLREGVLNSMFGYHLRQHKLLKLCHIDLIRQMAAQLRPRIFFPGDYITFINDIDECMYFIDEGTVDALSEDEMYTERIEKTLREGEMFGYVQGLYRDCGHELTYRTSTYSIILVLERKSWIHLLRFFPASEKSIYKIESH